MNAAIAIALVTVPLLWIGFMLRRRWPRGPQSPDARAAFADRLRGLGFTPTRRSDDEVLSGRLRGVGLTITHGAHGFGPRCEIELHLRAGLRVGFGAPVDADGIRVDDAPIDGLGVRGAELEALMLLLDDGVRAALHGLARAGATLQREPGRPRLLVQAEADESIEVVLGHVVALAQGLLSGAQGLADLVARAERSSAPHLAARARLLVLEARPEHDALAARVWDGLARDADRETTLLGLLASDAPSVAARATVLLAHHGTVRALSALRTLPANPLQAEAIAAILDRAGNPDHGRLALVTHDDAGGGLALAVEAGPPAVEAGPPAVECAVPSAGDSARAPHAGRS